MAGKIIGLVCFILCAVPFFAIGILRINSSEPISFWSGDETLKNRIKNVKGYNRQMARMFVICGFFLLAAGILIFIYPDAGIFLAALEFTVGLYLAYRFYKRTLARYS